MDNHIVEKINKQPSPSRAKLEIPIDNEYNIVSANGTARIVIQHEANTKYVYKVSTGHGINQNEAEIKTWNYVKNKPVAKHLLPIIDYDSNYRWTKVPYISGNIDFGLDKLHGPKAKEIVKELKKYDIYLGEVETVMYKGKAIAYDYGYHHKESIIHQL